MIDDYDDEDYGPYARKDKNINNHDTYVYLDDYREDFHADEAVGYVDYFEDGPFND